MTSRISIPIKGTGRDAGTVAPAGDTQRPDRPSATAAGWKDIGALEIARAAPKRADLRRGLRSRSLQVDQRPVRPRRRRPGAGDGRRHDQHNITPLYDIAARIPAARSSAWSCADRYRCRGRHRQQAAPAVRKQGRRPTLPAKRVTASFGVYRGDPASETLKSMLMAADRGSCRRKRWPQHRVRSAIACRSGTRRSVPDHSFINSPISANGIFL